MQHNTTYISSMLNTYKIFFEYDVKYSLIYGRNLYLIYNFMDVFNELLDKNISDKQAVEINNELKDKVNKFITFIESVEENEITNKKSKQNFTWKCLQKMLEEIKPLWDCYIISYNKIVQDVNTNIIRNMLIEVNNFFSHIIKYDCNDDNDNFKRAIAHLYRGTLDGYKDIIINNREIVCNNKSLKTRLLEIREQESHIIGAKELNNKEDFIKAYDDLCNSILTLKYLKNVS